MKTKEKQAGSASVESAHHTSCRPSDRDLVWHCAQCGLNEPAESVETERDKLREQRDELKQTLALYILNNGIIEQQRDELRKACDKADGIAADLDSMAGVSPEGRKAQSIGEKLHKLIQSAIKKAREAQP